MRYRESEMERAFSSSLEANKMCCHHVIRSFTCLFTAIICSFNVRYAHRKIHIAFILLNAPIPHTSAVHFGSTFSFLIYALSFKLSFTILCHALLIDLLSSVFYFYTLCALESTLNKSRYRCPDTWIMQIKFTNRPYIILHAFGVCTLFFVFCKFQLLISLCQ